MRRFRWFALAAAAGLLPLGMLAAAGQATASPKAAATTKSPSHTVHAATLSCTNNVTIYDENAHGYLEASALSTGVLTDWPTPWPYWSDCYQAGHWSFEQHSALPGWLGLDISGYDVFDSAFDNAGGDGPHELEELQCVLTHGVTIDSAQPSPSIGLVGLYGQAGDLGGLWGDTGGNDVYMITYAAGGGECGA